MIIYPAMDLIEGQCVRLLKGDFDTKTVYGINPFEQAQAFKNQGAEWLHIVDLDGAKAGKPQQTKLINDIANKVGLNIQTGGGLRKAKEIKTMIAAGINRVVIGSLAIERPETIKNLFDDLGPEAITLALDVTFTDAQAFIATNGWQKTSGVTLDEALVQFYNMGAKHLLITDISRDGLLIGPNVTLYKGLQDKFPCLDIQVSGGVSSLADLKNLSAINAKGVIIGKALYENKFSLAEALNIRGN
ncbi:MAG: 1-(5-phosphoribosyl)-5-[(5-phosphoribosylamino)methylideneamino]imidazole-4-carboxamide isomerase [Sphingomonadales bacterium]